MWREIESANVPGDVFLVTISLWCCAICAGQGLDQEVGDQFEVIPLPREYDDSIV